MALVKHHFRRLRANWYRKYGRGRYKKRVEKVKKDLEYFDNQYIEEDNEDFENIVMRGRKVFNL